MSGLCPEYVLSPFIINRVPYQDIFAADSGSATQGRYLYNFRRTHQRPGNLLPVRFVHYHRQKVPIRCPVSSLSPESVIISFF
ncbi:MAG: hypothetical protein DRI57_08180 [Deltaproteobacteria bacterium]|nr:MAG: hypothetical protein DRI57_08180 [Deltaproteobacteria bacterium]